MRLIRATPDFPDWEPVHALIADAFAYMTVRLGHPPQATLQNARQLATEAATGAVFLLIDHDRPVACLFCRPSRDHDGALYLGKLAVATDYRGGGLARRLIDAAEQEARAQGLHSLTLDTGAMLSELHAVFQRLGFSPPDIRPEVPGILTMMRQVVT